VRCCRYRVRPSLRSVWVDPNMDPRVEGLAEDFSNLLMLAAERGHIDQAIALLDHGANVNKTVVSPHGDVVSPLTFTMGYGEHDMCRLFLTRGAIPTTNDVYSVFGYCLQACKEKSLGLVEMSQ
jgi:ankyrin repeat protein